LESPVFLPPKLKSLLYLNSVLAHQPWLLKVDDIAALVKSGVNSWSLNELVQAICIMVHFHALQVGD
jgi:sestrin